MKEPWCLAASDAAAPTARIVNPYAKRWTIEPGFRDTKDLRFGMGLSASRIGEPARRDRLLLISAFAIVLLTMLGAAGEALGMDRLLKSNTAKTRTHALFRQGCMLYELIPTIAGAQASPPHDPLRRGHNRLRRLRRPVLGGGKMRGSMRRQPCPGRHEAVKRITTP
jgi:hypothetical protein